MVPVMTKVRCFKSTISKIFDIATGITNDSIEQRKAVLPSPEDEIDLTSSTVSFFSQQPKTPNNNRAHEDILHVKSEEIFSELYNQIIREMNTIKKF